LLANRATLLAQFNELRHNCAIHPKMAPTDMPKSLLIAEIRSSLTGISLNELLEKQPTIPRRTAQRLIRQLIQEGLINALGQGRARRYFAAQTPSAIHVSDRKDTFPHYIPLSSDSKDVVAYIGQPVAARKPIGYQLSFLDTYQPNRTFYLPLSLRMQLHKMGRTAPVNAPAGTYSRAILNRLLIDLSWASSNLEGNTYSRLDTRELIEQGKIAEGKATLETQMILNHKTAIELLIENIDSAEFNMFTIMNLHSALSENLLANPADEGRIRQHAVDISLSVYRPLATQQQIQTELEKLLVKANQIIDPFEQSFFMMVHLPYLQPFADINKRTSRLAANLPLFRANLCPLTFLDVPEEAYSCATLGVYEMTRIELLRDLYLWAYERSTQEYIAIKQTLAEPDPARLAWRGLIKTTVRYLVQHPEVNALEWIQDAISRQVPEHDQENIKAILIAELSRLHEGVLARYGLRPSEYHAWKASSN
jgi:Fic family protein